MRRIGLGTTAVALVLAAPAFAQTRIPCTTDTPTNCYSQTVHNDGSFGTRALTFTHNEQTLASGGTYSIASDTTIKYVDIEVTGAGAVRFSADSTAASATHGKPLNGAASNSQPQGGGFTYEATAVPQAVSFYALAATSIEITIGR